MYELRPARLNQTVIVSVMQGGQEVSVQLRMNSTHPKIKDHCFSDSITQDMSTQLQLRYIRMKKVHTSPAVETKAPAPPEDKEPALDAPDALTLQDSLRDEPDTVDEKETESTADAPADTPKEEDAKVTYSEDDISALNKEDLVSLAESYPELEIDTNQYKKDLKAELIEKLATKESE